MRMYRKVLWTTILSMSSVYNTYATDLNGLSSNSAQTITNFVSYIDSVGSTKSGITFSPATTKALARYASSGHNTTLTSPIFADGMTLELYSTSSLSLGGAAFTNSTAQAYITADLASSAVVFSTVPTFTGLGWIEINANTTMTFGAAMTFTAPIRVANGVTLTIADGGFAVVLSGIVSGAGTLLHSGSAKLTFAASPTVAYFTENTTTGFVLNDTVNISSAVALGANTGIDVASGGTGTVSGIISGAYTLTKGSNSSNLVFSGANTYSGGLTVSGGVVKAGNNAAFGTGTVIVTSGTIGFSTTGLVVANDFTPTAAIFNLDSGITATLSGALGVGAAQKAGAGTLILSNVGNGPTSWNFNGGRINLSGTGILGAPVTVNSPTTLGFLSTGSIANTFNLKAALTMDSPVGVTGTSGGVISGSNSLIKTGSGIVNLNAVNTFNGGLTVSAGQITLGNAAGFGAGNVTLAPTAILLTNAAARTVTSVGGSSTLSVY